MNTINALQVAEASGLFESRTEIRKAIKQKSLKINGQSVDTPEELIEEGDFLNFWTFQHGPQLMLKHGNVFLVVGHGKKERVLLKLLPDGTFQMLSDSPTAFV